MNVPNKFVSPLDDSQMESLENLFKNDSSFRVRMRAHSILLSSKGISIDDIAFIYSVNRYSVSSWIDAWEQSGLEGLYDQPRPGATPKLTESEVEVVKKLVEEHPTSPKTVLAKLAEKTGKNISHSTLKRIIKAAGLRWKRAKKSVKKKRDEKKFKAAKEEIQELKKQQQSGVIDLIYFDESGFSLDPSVPYAYQPIGQTTEITVLKSTRLNVLGFYNTNNNRLESFCFECSVDTSIVVTCFNEFIKTITKKTVVILDNASIHHSEEFKENIPKWKNKGLVLKYLPKYSPELNLIEILWRFIKHHWLPFSAYLSFKNLVGAVENILRNVGSEYKINFA